VFLYQEQALKPLKTFKEISKEKLPPRSSEFLITLFQKGVILKCGGGKTMLHLSQSRTQVPVFSIHKSNK
jgi:hypothetical protein